MPNAVRHVILSGISKPYTSTSNGTAETETPPFARSAEIESLPLYLPGGVPFGTLTLTQYGTFSPAFNSAGANDAGFASCGRSVSGQSSAQPTTSLTLTTGTYPTRNISTDDAGILPAVRNPIHLPRRSSPHEMRADAKSVAGRRISCTASASLAAAATRTASVLAAGAGRSLGTFQPERAVQAANGAFPASSTAP